MPPESEHDPKPAPAPGRRTRAWWPRVRVSARTTPARVWALTLLCVVTVAGLFGSASVTLNQAREGLAVLGDGAGQQALNTTGLYLNLAAMDASVADMLLMGTDRDLGSGREAAQRRYDLNRERADEVLLEVVSLTGGEDPREGAVEEHTGDDAGEGAADNGQRNVHALLSNLGAYHQEAERALQANDAAGAPPGEVDPEALAAYRDATRLMHTELLPKAFNLGLESSAIVRESHEEGRLTVTSGRAWVGAAGAVTVGSLLALQLYLRVRFRRRFNVALLVATAGAAMLTTGVVLALGGSEGHEVAAKEDGLDPAMALSRAGAIATDMQADQSRYLIDDERADTYQQVYLERAQQVLFRNVRTLPNYYEAVGEIPGAYPALPGPRGSDKDDPEGDPGTLGYLGRNAQEALLEGEEDSLGRVLTTFVAVQEADERMRAAAAEGDAAGAIGIRMEVADTEDGLFRQHEDALDTLAETHRNEYEEGIRKGQALLSPWTWGLPLGTLALFALVVAGVRPRLAEYR
ncbi:hypothetical protein [Nocardiopsis sp. NPDC058789]|uniref:hypothetical protein n=1 Tax=Nocardiopsis sp. NPDC058789 TaxID=3346634 RepID=UPI00366CBEF1